MDRIIVAALVALAFPDSALAEPLEALEDAPPVPESDGALLRSFVFASTSGPQRAALDLARAVSVVSTPADVLDWVSPVFVWLEPGYAYAETSITFQ